MVRSNKVKILKNYFTVLKKANDTNFQHYYITLNMDFRRSRVVSEQIALKV